MKRSDFLLTDRVKEIAGERYTYFQARIVHDCPYDGFIEELYNKGCTVAGHILAKAVEKEALQEFLRTDIKPKRLCEDRILLMQVFERAFQAEIAWQCDESPGTRRAVLRHLYDFLVYLDGQDNVYHWIYYDCCNYFVKLIQEYQIEASDEIMAKVYYRFALCKYEDEGACRSVCEALNKSLKLCETNLWSSDVRDDIRKSFNLQTGVATNFSKICIEYVQTLKKPDTIQEGVRLMDLAIESMGKLNLGFIRLKIIYYKTVFAKVEFCLGVGLFEEALQQIQNMKRMFRLEDEPTHLKLTEAKMNELEGICALKLGLLTLARKVLIEGTKVCEVNGFPSQMASISFNLGIAYFRSMNIPQANQAMKKARDLYMALGDEDNISKVKYMTAKLQSDTVLTEFRALVRSKDYESFDRLLKWSCQGKPFWDPKCKLQLSDYLAAVTPNGNNMTSIPSSNKTLTRETVAIPEELNLFAKNTGNVPEAYTHFPYTL